MIRDIARELEAVGLGLGATKTHWSSYQQNLERLHVDTGRIEWEQVLVFVGIALDLSGSSWASIRHRLNQGAVSMHILVKVCEWEKKDTSDDSFSVGERLVEKVRCGR